MTEIPQIIILIGLLVTASLGVKGWVTRLGLPAMLAFLFIGFLLRFGEDALGFLPASGPGALKVLGDIGIVCLLFRVGIEADLFGLLAQFRSASLIWVCNVAVSAVCGFGAAYYLLDLGIIPSFVIAVALTATSIAIPVQIWQSQGALRSANGQRFVEVAELDDISAVVLMALLFWVADDIHHGVDSNLIAAKLGRGIVEFGLKFLLFVGLCYLFARYWEKPIMTRLRKLKPAPDPMLSLVGIAFVIAGFAGLLGFSLAVGAFFAGLAFSRDPRAVRMEASFETIYELFTPFFFIHIGFLISSSGLGGGVGTGAVLLVAAIAGKVIGTLFPSRVRSTWPDAWILSVSMVPRSEICLLVMQTALITETVHLPQEVFSGMVLVCAATSVLAPILLQVLLKRRLGESSI